MKAAKKFANAKSSNDKYVMYREVFEGDFYTDYMGKTSHRGKIKAVYRKKVT